MRQLLINADRYRVCVCAKHCNLPARRPRTDRLCIGEELSWLAGQVSATRHLAWSRRLLGQAGTPRRMQPEPNHS